jgi:hypothetical protein
MTKSELAAAIATRLEAGREITCALGTIELREYIPYLGRDPRHSRGSSVLKKVMPYFVPDDVWLTALFGDDRVVVPAPRPRTLAIYSPYSASDPGEEDLQESLVYVDDDGALAREYEGVNLVSRLPPKSERQVDTLELGAMLDVINTTLRGGKHFKMTGLLTLGTRQLKPRRLDLELPAGVEIADAHLAGKWTAYGEWGQVIKNILNGLP